MKLHIRIIEASTGIVEARDGVVTVGEGDIHVQFWMVIICSLSSFQDVNYVSTHVRKSLSEVVSPKEGDR